MTTTTVVILIITSLAMLGSIASALVKLNASGKETDTPKATLYAVQACGGLLLAWVIATMGTAALIFIR